MDSTIHPDHVVNLRATLDDGPPLPSFVVSDLRSRNDDVDIVIETTEAHVRLTTSGTANPRPNERIVNLTSPVPVRSSIIYPGIMLDNRYDL